MFYIALLESRVKSELLYVQLPTEVRWLVRHITSTPMTDSTAVCEDYGSHYTRLDRTSEW
jgi:hypothetical protein